MFPLILFLPYLPFLFPHLLLLIILFLLPVLWLEAVSLALLVENLWVRMISTLLLPPLPPRL
jgi:hypothetical protein